MSVAKNAAGVVFGLIGLGISGVGASQAIASSHSPVPQAPDISLRAYPAKLEIKGGSAPTPVAAKPEVAEPVADPPKPAVVDAGAPPAAVVPPVAAKPVPEPVAAKPDPAAAKPVPVPAPVVAKPAAAPVATGILNLRASDTADVFVDGRKVGTTPVPGYKTKVGKHVVRFDCYDAAGNTVAGAPQSAEVAAGQEVDLDYKCPE